MDRTGRFRELFRIGGDSPDPARIPDLMRFGGFGEKDSYLVEAAVRLSPEAFSASFSDPDDARAYDAANSLQVPGIVPIISDMRKALGLSPLHDIRQDADRRVLFEEMIRDLGRSSLADGSMSRRGFLPEDVLMVRYIARCCGRDLSRMAWDPDQRTARRAAESIADATSLDLTAVLSLMDDIRTENTAAPPPPPDPGLIFKKSRPSEAKLVRYTGSEAVVEIPQEAVVEGVRLRVTSISDNAFARNTGLMEVSIPGTVRIIGRYAFFGCTALTDARMSEGTRTIEMGAFCRCASLESVDLPTGLESIGDQAFLGCPMEEMFVPASVNSVGRHAFPADCRLIGRSLGA